MEIFWKLFFPIMVLWIITGLGIGEYVLKNKSNEVRLKNSLKKYKTLKDVLFRLFVVIAWPFILIIGLFTNNNEDNKPGYND